MISKPENTLCLDYFSGGVPPGMGFAGTLDDIRRTAQNTGKERGIDRVAELSFVGVLSYFEAFCKDHASTIVSISPSLIDRLRTTGHNVMIDAQKALTLGNMLPAKIGFLILETHDFGSAKKINSMFESLLRITPFSKDESRHYEELLRDRNLIVHHGSVFTTRYLEQSRAQPLRGMSAAFMDSLVVDGQRVCDLIDFISVIARKILGTSHAALKLHLESSSEVLDPERQKALEFFGYWDDWA